MPCAQAKLFRFNLREIPSNKRRQLGHAQILAQRGIEIGTGEFGGTALEVGDEGERAISVSQRHQLRRQRGILRAAYQPLVSSDWTLGVGTPSSVSALPASNFCSSSFSAASALAAFCGLAM